MAAGIGAFVCATTARADAVVGEAAPAFIAPTLDGKNFDLASLKGKVVIINFWATWCAPCRDEMPSLEAIWRRYRSEGLEVLAVSADRPRTQEDVGQVMKYFSFPAAMLSKVSKNELVEITSVPVTYVIGRDGKVADILTLPTSPLTEAGLGDEVKALLAVKPEAKIDDGSNPKAEIKAETKGMKNNEP